MAIQLPILFPHPLLPRKDMTPAEKAFFREAMRRLKPFIGKANLSIDDAPRRNGEVFYRLTAKWTAPDREHKASGVGPTPGDALTVLIAKVRPE